MLPPGQQWKIGKACYNIFTTISSVTDHIHVASPLEAVVRADLVVEPGVEEVRDTRVCELDVGTSAARVPTIRGGQWTDSCGESTK
jgi:hypothetical protein